MNRRNKISGGQALVMITLALIAMCGMMGLAVDLGWSYFVQKAAQAAADGAALGGVQEAYKLNGGTGLNALTCGTVACENPTPKSCQSISSGNLKDACQFAV